MFKIMAFLSKREDIETRAFIEYYEQHHVPLIRSLAPTPIGYRRNYLLRGDELNIEDDSIDFDVVTELTFPDRAAYLEWAAQLSRSTAGRADHLGRRGEVPGSAANPGLRRRGMRHVGVSTGSGLRLGVSSAHRRRGRSCRCAGRARASWMGVSAIARGVLLPFGASSSSSSRRGRSPARSARPCASRATFPTPTSRGTSASPSGTRRGWPRPSSRSTKRTPHDWPTSYATARPGEREPAGVRSFLHRLAYGPSARPQRRCKRDAGGDAHRASLSSPSAFARHRGRAPRRSARATTRCAPWRTPRRSRARRRSRPRGRGSRRGSRPRAARRPPG